jgi:ketosteroid isomerase-like protein
MQSKKMGLALGAISTAWLLLVACGGETPAPQPPPPPPAPPPVASAPPPADTTPPPPPKPSLAQLIPLTLKSIGDAFNGHDAKAMAGYFTDDAVVSAYGAPEAHGRAELANTMDTLFSTFSDAKSVPARVWIKGNVAVAETIWAGTMTGDFMGMKATKKPAGQYRVDVMWFNDDGLVKEAHEYGDDAGLVAQLQGKKGAPPVPTLPTNPPDVHAARATPDEDKLADWGKAMDETFSKDDAKAVLAGTADDADYWMNFTGGPATKGKKDLTKDLDGFFKAFPDQKWTTTNAWGIDGFAIVEHTMTGTQKGRLGPLPPSGKEVKDWHWVDIMQPSADGKLQHGWGYTNLVEMMMQTGAIKPPPAPTAAAAPDATKTAPPKTDAPKGDAPKK